MAGSKYLGMGSRLTKEPDAALADAAFRFELAAAAILLPGLSLADLAHVIMLERTGLVDPILAARLTAGLVVIHEEGPAAIPLDPRIGDPYNNRHAHVAERLGPAAGVLHTGRARREAATIAWQLATRAALLDLGASAASLGENIVHVAGEHLDAVMPDFTYLHHAHPTTLAHYLLGFAYPVTRDLERLRRAFALVNRSPAGSGSVNGSRLPLDRALLAEILEFDGLAVHTRDAMWAPDMALEPLWCALSLMTTCDRLAEELQLWSTAEFDFIELDDAHCRTSVIMPQKKNPYGLAYVRGRARDLIGRFAGIAATNMTPTGQPDNRIFAYEAVPELLDETRRAVELLAASLGGARFNLPAMRAAAESGHSYATDLCDHLVLTAGLDNRSAHRVVGRAIRAALDAGDEPVGAGGLAEAAAALGVELRPLDEAELAAIRRVEEIVAARRGPGGAGAEPMAAMLAEQADEITAAKRFFVDHPLAGFEDRVLARAREIGAPGAGDTP